MKRLLLHLAATFAAAQPAAAQNQAFCNGVLGLVAGYIGCPPDLDEIGGAAIGVVCVGDGGVSPRPPPEIIDGQVRACLPSGWAMGEVKAGTVANRRATYREYVRASDKLRLQVGQFLITRDTSPRSARATLVEHKQAFIAVPPAD